MQVVNGDFHQSSSLYQKVSERHHASQPNQSLLQSQQQQSQYLSNSNSNTNLGQFQQQPTANQSSGFKSKFTLVNRPIDLMAVAPQSSKEKSKKSFMFGQQSGVNSANQSVSGAESYRKMSSSGQPSALTLQQQQLQAQIQMNQMAAAAAKYTSNGSGVQMPGTGVQNAFSPKQVNLSGYTGS